MPVGELLARMSAYELTEWAAFERIEGPLGSTRGDMQAAIVASTVANTSKGKQGRRATPKDFLPDWGRRKRASMGQWARAVNAAHNRKKKEPRDG